MAAVADMNRLLFSGMFEADSGPAIVNKAYAEACSDWLSVRESRPSITTVLHFARHAFAYRGVLVSSTSGYHVLLLILARLVGRDAIYLAHGVGRLERRINGARSLRAETIEKLTVRLASKVVAVSTRLADQMVREYSVPASRVKAVLNGTYVFDSSVLPAVPPALNGCVRVMTVGTKPIKNIETLCRALDRADLGSIEFVVIGPVDEVELPSNPRIKNLQVDTVPHDCARSWMGSSDIFVQLSLVEAFGLAICEAAEAGCVLLLSSRVGSLPALEGLTSANLVEDPTDIDLVVQRLECLVQSVRAGTAQRQACPRSWQQAGEELAAAIGP